MDLIKASVLFLCDNMCTANSDRKSTMSKTSSSPPPSFISAPPVSALIWGHLSALQPIGWLAVSIPAMAWAWDRPQSSVRRTRLAADKGQRQQGGENKITAKATNVNNLEGARVRQEVHNRKKESLERSREVETCCRRESVTLLVQEEAQSG